MVKLQWNSATGYDPYRNLIEKFIGREFPQLASKASEDLMETIVEEFIGSKQTRVGPRPIPESLVKMRDVVRRAVQANRSIPVLIAVASVKVPLGNKIDLAELSALKMLGCLNDRVKRHYEPGMDFRLRLEDLTEIMLSGDTPEVRKDVAEYREQFTKLIQVLGMESFIHAVPESSMVDETLFLNEARRNAARMSKDILAVEKGELKDDAMIGAGWGWKGGLSKTVRNYYCDRYTALYPNTDHTDHIKMMGDYFGTVLARHQLGVIGQDKSFDGRLEIGFNEPPPNAPPISTRVFYRSVMLDQSSNNRPYWYAKGYLKIDEQDQMRLRFGKFNEEGMQKGTLTIHNGDLSVTIEADYVQS